MLEKNEKKFLYKIIDMYLSGKIDASTFCDEFYYSYGLELDHNFLNEIEKKVFSDLGGIVDRFSPFEKDLKEYPQFFVSEEYLKKNVYYSKDRLGSYFFDYLNCIQKEEMDTSEDDKLAQSLGTKYFLCPLCQEVWEDISMCFFATCPKCNSKLQNPRFYKTS
ncbi:MAG: hypothetical protein K2X69_10775 [Silvanigrellaceae bacterium]|nr:hypothetical protein [Silvanigrellaceae bacterium]